MVCVRTTLTSQPTYSLAPIVAKPTGPLDFLSANEKRGRKGGPERVSNAPLRFAITAMPYFADDIASEICSMSGSNA